jgi:hypothetical protein
MIDTKELRRLAQAATPHVGHACKYQDAHCLREGHVDFENADLFIASERPQEDAAFYAAANPATVSELLDRIETAEKELDTLRAKVEAMEKQEPVARFNWSKGKIEWLRPWDYSTMNMKPLYLAPGAQPAPSVSDLLESLRCACNYIDKLGGVSQQYRAMLASPEAKP